MTIRERLFDAAVAIYAEEGLGSLSLRAVGRRAGVSAMAIYRYFPDKHALIDALLEDGFAAWEQRVAKLPTDDPLVWLRSLLAAYRDFALQQPHQFDAAFLLPARTARKFPDDFDAGRSPVIRQMISQIERGQADGHLQNQSPMRIALTLAALAQGMVSMQRAGRFSNDEQFTESYRDVLESVLASFSTTATINATEPRNTTSP